MPWMKYDRDPRRQADPNDPNPKRRPRGPGAGRPKKDGVSGWSLHAGATGV